MGSPHHRPIRRPWHLMWASPLVVVAVLWALAGFDGGYLARVVRHLDASTDDYRWKRSFPVAAATTPRPWRTAPDCPAVEVAFTADPDGADLDRHLADSGTLGLVVIRNGTLSCERHSNGGAAGQPAAAFSVSKTVLSLLVARAVADGQIELTAPITRWIPELRSRDSRFDRITVANLIDMRSGLAFRERTTFPWVNQDQPAVYYATDLARVVVDRPQIESAPGLFHYNDYAPNLVGLALQRATGQPLRTAIQRLWTDLGAQDAALWSTDDHGFAYHESGFVATARDLARIGQLVLDGGRVAGSADGRTVAPSEFLARSLDPVGRDIVLSYGGVEVGYRNGWWVLPRADGGADLLALGRHGQIMLVSPATRTVIVRLGLDGHGEQNLALGARLQRVADRLAAADTAERASSVPLH